MPTRLRHGRGVGFPSRIAGTCFSVHRQCSISHCAEPADRDLCARQRGVSRGSRGLSPSSASPRTCGVWPRGVCCLRPLKSLASLCGGRRNTAPGIARNRLDRAVTGNLLGLLAAIPANGEERPAPHHASVMVALSAANRFPPYPPYPSVTRDRRSQAILQPVGNPNCFRPATIRCGVMRRAPLTPRLPRERPRQSGWSGYGWSGGSSRHGAEGSGDLATGLGGT